MKLSQCLFIIGACAGLIAVAVFALSRLHNTILEDCQRGIHAVLNLSVKQLEYPE